jgi:YD repeat-containing protein
MPTTAQATAPTCGSTGNLVAHHDYNAANQVEGWSYDAAGNLLDDGTTTYSYDALKRTLTAATASATRSYTYNGDGVLVWQAANSVESFYTQDLAAPLSQVLMSERWVGTIRRGEALADRDLDVVRVCGGKCFAPAALATLRHCASLLTHAVY